MYMYFFPVRIEIMCLPLVVVVAISSCRLSSRDVCSVCSS